MIVYVPKSDGIYSFVVHIHVSVTKDEYFFLVLTKNIVFVGRQKATKSINSMDKLGEKSMRSVKTLVEKIIQTLFACLCLTL